MAFRWHSNLASDADATFDVKTHTHRLEPLHQTFVQTVRDAHRTPQGTIADPKPLQQMLLNANPNIQPRSLGYLLAVADLRIPTLEEFSRYLDAPPAAPSPAPSPPQQRHGRRPPQQQQQPKCAQPRVVAPLAHAAAPSAHAARTAPVVTVASAQSRLRQHFSGAPSAAVVRSFDGARLVRSSGRTPQHVPRYT